MPMGNNNGDTETANTSQDRPVVFQKYFKSGGRTYASQIKLASNGKKYLVLTEGVRDPQTQEVKKHILRVFESDLKAFFAMLQETVLYLRSTKDPGSTVAGLSATKPAIQAQSPAARKPARPAVPAAAVGQPAVKSPSTGNARPPLPKPPQNGAARATPVAKAPSNGTAKPAPARAGKGVSVPVISTKVAKPPYRPAGRAQSR